MFQPKWHNPSKTPTYYAWKSMRRRCLPVEQGGHKRYGGRGISVCTRWESYDNFVQDMGFRPIGLTLERIINDGNYEPGNCRWATRKEQAVNRSDNHILTFEGESLTVTEWAKKLEISPKTLFERIRSGLDVKEVLSREYRREIEAPHGSISRYTNRKCRCDLCKTAWRNYHRKRRA